MELIQDVLLETRKLIEKDVTIETRLRYGSRQIKPEAD
jgi:hypothetical protein